jgi:ketosteroid isomerase-like protein
VVFAWVHFGGRGAGSGIPMEWSSRVVPTIRDGKSFRLVEYTDRHEASKPPGCGPR